MRNRDTESSSCARRPVLWLLGAAVLVAACGDAPTEPHALVVAQETEAALQIALALPTLPRLVADAGVGSDLAPDSAVEERLARAQALWLEAESAGREPRAKSLRDAAYRVAAPALATRLGAVALSRMHAALNAWIDAATRLVGRAELPALREQLEQGRAHLERARAAQGRGDEVAAIAETLRAADRLRETTPRAVAMRLIRVGEAALESRSGSVDEEDDAARIALSRAERLLRGSRDALANGEYARAIQRAYYAVQLLE